MLKDSRNDQTIQILLLETTHQSRSRSRKKSFFDITKVQNRNFPNCHHFSFKKNFLPTLFFFFSRFYYFCRINNQMLLCAEESLTPIILHTYTQFLVRRAIVFSSETNKQNLRAIFHCYANVSCIYLREMCESLEKITSFHPLRSMKLHPYPMYFVSIFLPS